MDNSLSKYWVDLPISGPKKRDRARTPHSINKRRHDLDLRRRLLKQWKSRPCTDCGIAYDSVCMDWDHLPSREKIFQVGEGIEGNLERLLEEVVKCELVCANCHRYRTKLRSQASLG